MSLCWTMVSRSSRSTLLSAIRTKRYQLNFLSYNYIRGWLLCISVHIISGFANLSFCFPPCREVEFVEKPGWWFYDDINHEKIHDNIFSLSVILWLWFLTIIFWMQTIILTYSAHQVKAMHFCLKLKDERNGRPKTETIDDDPFTDERVCT